MPWRHVMDVHNALSIEIGLLNGLRPGTHWRVPFTEKFSEPPRARYGTVRHPTWRWVRDTLVELLGALHREPAGLDDTGAWRIEDTIHCGYTWIHLDPLGIARCSDEKFWSEDSNFVSNQKLTKCRMETVCFRVEFSLVKFRLRILLRRIAAGHHVEDDCRVSNVNEFIRLLINS